ncbi:MAG TPA: isovaleryl-CoA dehydrogenase [Steroidobacteraceae bacterium]|jgi:putative acyl-CoA dehydrogenase|nr:isovaleryl-CoA dehydrogenase [Steroidobacteraceae bacterium]
MSCATPEVLNQSSELVDYNLFSTCSALQEALAREGAAADHAALTALGAQLGTAEMFALGDAANRNPPQLRALDRCGARCDQVEFHPAWHELLRRLIGAGLHTGPWAQPRRGAHVARAAGYMLWAEIENGTQCPATMSYGAVPALAAQGEDFAPWLQLLLSREYDARFTPAADKRGALIGMGMTERQGGSDVRTNTTRAVPCGARGPGREYRLTGHKWFFSAPMCDAFLVLAQANGGLSCLLVPRFLPDRSINRLHLQRLKDKVGNRSNASSEVEFDAAYGVLLAEEGRGIPAILAMGVYTRLDNAVASAGLMRQCVAQAIHHARGREAFGRRLAEQPLMMNVLADLALECEAAVVLAMRLARAFDALADEAATLLRRVLTPAAKYWICKRAPTVCAEAMEVLGGNGYVEEGPIARRFRESPLNSIWEGSGNIMCLDVLRALTREPRTRASLEQLLAEGQGCDERYDRFRAALSRDLDAAADGELRARELTQRIALAVQAALFLSHGPAASCEAFLASRLAGGAPAAFGTLPAHCDFSALTARIFQR